MWPATQSMGDALVASGLVRFFSKKCNKIFVPVAEWMLSTIECMYESDDKIEVILYQGDAWMKEFCKTHACAEIKGPSIYTYDNKCVLWDEQFYAYYDIPFSLRYTGFKIPQSVQRRMFNHTVMAPDTPYVVLHDHTWNMGIIPIDLHTWRTPEDQTLFNSYQQIHLDPSVSSNLWDYLPLIQGAKELHCIPSCVFCLVDGIQEQTTAKLYYHNIRENTVMRVNNQWNNNCWTIIDYPHKINW